MLRTQNFIAYWLFGRAVAFSYPAFFLFVRSTIAYLYRIFITRKYYAPHHCEVGRNYHWVDRLGWTDEQIQAYLSQLSVSLWVLYCGGAPGGYFELCQHEDDSSVEIAYFGLLKEFIGRGLGKYLLSFAVERAWEKTIHRVWLHTCTLDHPDALSNYVQRGFKPFQQETYIAKV